MMTLFKKEWKLVMMPVPLLFLLLSGLVLIPNYPYYVTFFYTTLGIFLMMQSARENRDLYYMALLPVTKREMVRRPSRFRAVDLRSFSVSVRRFENADLWRPFTKRSGRTPLVKARLFGLTGRIVYTFRFCKFFSNRTFASKSILGFSKFP